MLSYPLVVVPEHFSGFFSQKQLLRDKFLKAVFFPCFPRVIRGCRRQSIPTPKSYFSTISFSGQQSPPLHLYFGLTFFWAWGWGLVGGGGNRLFSRLFARVFLPPPPHDSLEHSLSDILIVNHGAFETDPPLCSPCG